MTTLVALVLIGALGLLLRPPAYDIAAGLVCVGVLAAFFRMDRKNRGADLDRQGS